MPGEPLFRFRHVAVTTAEGGQRLRAVTATVRDGCLTVIVGPSGSGKSTLLRLCNHLDAPTSGVVEYRGRDTADLDPLALRRAVGMVFQKAVLFPGTVLDNLRVARPDGDDMAFRRALAQADLDPGFLPRDAGTLSGGEAQRVCLARAVATEPDVLLMDEPTSALDPASTAAIEELARRSVDRGRPVIWVTHDLAQMRRLADDVVVLIEGRVAQFGPLPELTARPTNDVARFLQQGDANGHS